MAGDQGERRPPADPFAQLQQFITDWERRIDGVANRVMGTDEFSRSMNAVQKLQLNMQKAFMEAMATHLNNLNMPSRADITELGERLIAVEQRLARIEGMLASERPGANEAPAARRGPPRTRRPPSVATEGTL